MLSGERKHSPNENSMSQGYSEGHRGLEAREEIGGWGLGVIFDASEEKNHKWLDAKSAPPSK